MNIMSIVAKNDGQSIQYCLKKEMELRIDSLFTTYS